MLRKLLMPKLGLTMTEGVLAEWSVQPGTPFKADSTLFVVETDKVANEVPAEADGVLTEVTAEAGQTVAVGEVLGYWDDGMPDAENVTRDNLMPAASPAGMEARLAAAPAQPTQPASQAQQPASAQFGGALQPHRILATPLARRIAGIEGIDLGSVKGTGPRQAVMAQDIRGHAATAVRAATSKITAIDAGTRQKPTFVQSAMARRLTAVKQQVPHFYLALEADVSKLLALREQANTLETALRFTINHFIVAAVGRALVDLPETNAVWSDGEILRYHSTDVGVAVNAEHGLLVPVVRDVGRLAFTDVAQQTNLLIERARSGRVQAQEMQGGAITVSNAGMFNVKFMTPIINPGQAMILGVGSISQQFRPDSEGRPALTKEMGLVLAGDHRLMDGVSGLKFLNRVAFYLEQPLNLLLGQALVQAG